MALILRAYSSASKGFLCENLGNLLRTRACLAHNGYILQTCAATRSAKYCSTKCHQKAPTERNEIYYGTLTKRVRNLKSISLITSLIGLGAQPYLYLKATENDDIMVILSVCASITFIAFFTPLMIHMVLKRYVTHLYYDEKNDKYIANTYSLFVRKKELEFTTKDVVVPAVDRIFSNCTIKGNHLFLEQNLFKDSNHYIRIMGYDEPMDFKLGKISFSQIAAAQAETKIEKNKK